MVLEVFRNDEENNPTFSQATALYLGSLAFSCVISCVSLNAVEIGVYIREIILLCSF